MGRIISFYNSKGGTGKTTFNIITSCIIANYTKASVCLIEGDPQEDVLNKHKTSMKDLEQEYGNNIPENFKKISIIKVQWPAKDNTSLYMNSVLKTIEENEDKYDYIFINLWGILHAKGMGNVLAKINHFFIPIEVDDETLISAIKLMKILQKIQTSEASNIRSFHLFKNKVTKNKKTQEWRDLNKFLESKNYPTLNSYIKENVEIDRSKGSTIYPIDLHKDYSPIEQKGLFYPFFKEIMKTIKDN